MRNGKNDWSSSMKKILQNGRLFLDGGFGTELYKLNITVDPAAANLTHPQAVMDIHRAYAAAGADIITANTFGSHKFDNCGEIISAAVQNARTAAPSKLIALDIGPTGLLPEPYGTTTREELSAIFASIVSHGVYNGVDLILVETMGDLIEIEIAVTEAKKTALPVFATMSFSPTGRTMYGVSIADMTQLLTQLGVDALGLNCGEGLDAYAPIVTELLDTTKHSGKGDSFMPVIFQPNAGLPQVLGDGTVSYSVSPEGYARFMVKMAKLGVAVLGGCCGTTPAHIAAMVGAVDKLPTKV